MDRFIPNRSSSNLDSAQYNIALEMKDVENMNTNMAGSSPSKVGVIADDHGGSKNGNEMALCPVSTDRM